MTKLPLRIERLNASLILFHKLPSHKANPALSGRSGAGDDYGQYCIQIFNW